MKRIISLLLSTLMVVTLGTVNVFGEGNVAKIGDTGYETLAAAIAAVPNDGTETTIVMIGDVDYTSFNAEDSISASIVIPNGKNITLDLNGKTISGLSSASTAAYLFHNKGYLTIIDSQEGGKITYKSNGPDGTYGYGTSTILNRGVLTIESGTVENTTSGGASYAVDNQTLWYDDVIPVVFNLKGGIVECTTGDAAIRQGAGCGEKYTKGGEIVKNTVNISGGIVNNDIWIQNLTVDNKGSYTELIITDGTINGTVYDTVTSDYSNQLITIDGGYIANSYSRNNGYSKFITGGYFKNDVSSWVKDGYECISTPETDPNHNNYPYVIGKIEVAEIGDTTYPSLEDAIDKVKDNETIALLKDITINSKIVIPDEKSFTIDLKGKTITTSAVTGFEIDSANLTVKNGTVKNNNADGLKGGTMETRTKAFFVWKDGIGSLTLDAVKIESTGYCVNANNVKNNEAKNKSIVINNCDFASSKWGAVYANSVDGSNELTITNSNIYSSWTGTNMAAVQICMKTTIEKTTITNDYGAALGCFENTDLLLKGTENSFTGAAGAISTNGSQDLVQITIEGGTYKTTGTSNEAGIAFYHPDGSPLTIKGGIFEGATALYVKGGTIDIQEGSFTGTGAYAAAQKVESGAHATGDAVVIEASGYLSGQPYNPEPNPSVKISGGLFTSTSENGSPVAYYTFDGNNEAHNGKMISGGWFSKKVPTEYVVEGYNASDDLTDKGAPNSINVYTVVKEVAVNELKDTETNTVQESGKSITTTFGTYVAIDKTLPDTEQAKISSIKVSNLNNAITDGEKNSTLVDAKDKAKTSESSTVTAEVEIIMNVELAKSSKIESLAEKIAEDKEEESVTYGEVEYIDITIDKIVKANGNVIEIKEVKTTDEYQIISFPVASVFGNDADKEKVFVYRNHIDENGLETNVSFPKVEKDYGPSFNGECYWIDGDNIYIKAKNFSVYGFGVQSSEIPAIKKLTPTPGPIPSSDDSNIGGYKIPKTGIR